MPNLPHRARSQWSFISSHSVSAKMNDALASRGWSAAEIARGDFSATGRAPARSSPVGGGGGPRRGGAQREGGGEEGALPRAQKKKMKFARGPGRGRNRHCCHTFNGQTGASILVLRFPHPRRA